MKPEELKASKLKLGYFYKGDYERMFEKLNIPTSINARLVVHDSPFDNPYHYKTWVVQSMLKRIEPYIHEACCLLLCGWFEEIARLWVDIKKDDAFWDGMIPL